MHGESQTSSADAQTRHARCTDSTCSNEALRACRCHDPDTFKPSCTGTFVTTSSSSTMIRSVDQNHCAAELPLGEGKVYTDEETIVAN